MAVNKNFVIRNGFEASTNLIFADANTRRVGVGTTAPQYLLHVSGGIGVTNAYVSGIGTFADELNVGLGGTVLTVLGIGNSIGIGTALPAFLLDVRSPVSTGQTALFVQGDIQVTGDIRADDIIIDDALIQDLTISNTFIVAGLSTFNSNVFINAALNVSGISTFGDYVDINNSVDVSNNLNVSGVSTFVGFATFSSNILVAGIGTITNLVSTSGTITTLGSTNGTITNLTGTNVSYSGISTLGTVRISSGIITATSGIVTYFGDGNFLNLTSNPSRGIGIGTTGGVVGYAVTFIDFKGSGVSTAFYNSNTGIATIFFEGGGGGSGSIGIGSTFSAGAANGDLFFHIDYGRIFVYYDEVTLGVGTDEYWIDAAPFNVGIITSLSNVSFSPGSALAPSMFFIGDQQTGFFSPGNGQFTVVSSGSSVLNINASGIRVTGIATFTNASGTVKIGIGTTALLVEGNARVTGILTVGSSSITLNGTTNIINVGTGLTLSSSGINVTGVITATSFVGNGSGLTGVGIGSTGSINTSGIITATSFVGNGSGLTGVGIGSTGSINTSGIITATSFSGSGANLTGIANTANIRSDTITVGVLTATSINVPPIPIVFSPAIGATGVSLSSNIIITFNQQLTKGTGSITLRANSAGGTAFSTIGVSSSSVTISGGAVTIDPPSNIGVGVTTFVVVDAGAFSGLTTTSLSAIINTYSFRTTTFAFSSINPANGATAIGIGTNITLTFTEPPTRGTGTITLRSGSTSGSVIETFDAATSGQISISGNDYIIDPTSNLGFSTSIHTIIPSTAINGYVGLNTTGADTHSFTTAAVAVGDSYEGGFLICKASPLRWVVSPRSAEVSRTWYLRNDANTRSQTVSGCTGWFVPTKPQLQNPGYCCRSFWGPSPCYSSTLYWSSTEHNTVNACGVYFNNGGAFNGNKTDTRCVRAFRCVTY